MLDNFFVEGLPDGELTDPEVRRLIYEVVRERFRVISDTHLSEYWEAKRRYEQTHGSEVRSRPFPRYDPSEIQDVYDALLAQAKTEVLALRKLDLGEAADVGAVPRIEGTDA